MTSPGEEQSPAAESTVAPPAKDWATVVEHLSKGIGPLNSIAHYKGFSHKFSGLEEAEQFLNSKVALWFPSDREVPDDKTDDGRKKILDLVRSVYEAMADMSSFEDKMPEFGRRRIPVMIAGKYTDSQLEATSWKVVYAAIALHEKGSCLPPAQDFAVAADKELDFDRRMDAICDAIRVAKFSPPKGAHTDEVQTWKTCAQDCLDQAKLQTVVHAPKTAATVGDIEGHSEVTILISQQRKANNKRNNIEKGKDLAVGISTRLAKGDRAGNDDGNEEEEESSNPLVPRITRRAPANVEDPKTYSSLDELLASGDSSDVEMTTISGSDDKSWHHQVAKALSQEQDIAEEEEDDDEEEVR